MAVIVPTITTDDPHVYREQLERTAKFAPRIHIDLADGKFTPNKLIEINSVWLPESIAVDIHAMYKKPQDIVEKLSALKPSLIVFHAEAETDFLTMAEHIHRQGILFGVAILQDTPVSSIHKYLHELDHVLIFSGTLGSFGGQVDLDLLDKVKELKAVKLELEIGWDGGINALNAKDLVEGGVDVLNVGGFIQKSADPEAAYAKLQVVLNQSK